jgi:POT family proton-dependent oligopeptide transporter
VSDASPLLTLAFIPLFNYLVYPAISRVFPLTPLRKISIGFFLTATSFVVVWWIQAKVDDGRTPNVAWQLLAHIIMTASEVMVYISGLEFSYTQAPPKLKSVIMALWFLAASIGNQFTTAMHALVPTLKRYGVELENAGWYRFFALVMLGTAILFIFVARLYRGRTYFQGEQGSELATAETLSS